MTAKKCPVFICYRQVDGMKIAQWLFKILNGQRLPDIRHMASEEVASSLDVYFDQTAPAVGDWKAIHQPRLHTSRAMIIVCTPGAFHKLGENDWVYREMDWWLKNRKVAPILIDATGEGERWVPKVIKDRWPDAQRIMVVHDELLRLQGHKLRHFEQQIRSRILEGIILSKRSVVYEELERQKKMAKSLEIALERQKKTATLLETALERQKRMSRRLRIALLVTLFLSALAGWQWWRAEEQTRIALDQKKIALARQLSAQAQFTIDQKPNLLQRGVLLAVESMRRLPSLEIDQALRQGLILLPRFVTRLVHDHVIQFVTFSPDGKYLATASWDETARLWDATTGKELARMKHNGAVRCVSFSPDGKYLATASGDGTTSVWEVPGGRRKLEPMNHEDEVRYVTFSSDGKYLATASYDKTARIWNLTNGTEIACMNHKNRVRSVAFSPDDKYLATASYGTTARIWNATNGTEIACMNHNGYVSSIAFSPDGKCLATASSDNTARLWNVTTGEELASMEHQNFGGEVRCLAFSPDGRYLATASRDRTAIVWDVNSSTELIRLNHGGDVYSIIYSPDGKYLATASGDQTVRVWEVTSGRELTRINHAGALSIAFSPDGKYLATASIVDNTAWVWESTSRAEIRVTNDGMVGCVAFSPDGKHLATASSGDTKSAQVWEATKGIRIAHKKHDNVTHAIALSPDGQYLATASSDNTARVWENITSVSEVNGMKHCMNHDGAVRSIAFSPNQKYLATGSQDDTARLWELIHGREIARMKHKGHVLSVAFSPDGKYLATASRANTARIWEVPTDKELARITHENSVFFVTFSPDGKYLATACQDGSARIWQMPSDEELVSGSEATIGEEMARMTHEEHVTSVAFSPDGKYLATASVDRTARIWELPSCEEVTRISNKNWVLSVAFSPDGRYLATGIADGTARVSLVQRNDLISEACLRLTRNLTYQEWQQYLPDEPYGKTCPDLPIHPSFIEAGRDLAKADDVESAIAIFRRAIELEPNLDIDPEAEAKRLAFQSDDLMRESHKAKQAENE